MKKAKDQQEIKFPKPIPNMPKWWQELYPEKHPDKNKHPDTKKEKKVYELPF